MYSFLKAFLVLIKNIWHCYPESLKCLLSVLTHNSLHFAMFPGHCKIIVLSVDST